MGVLSTRSRVLTIGSPLSAIFARGAAAAEAYKDKVLGYNPIAYWMLAEAAGVTAIDQIDSPAQDGTHDGVTLGQPGIGDGETCPLYDGNNDVTDIYSTTFRDAFPSAEGTILIWAKVSGAGVWSDGAERTAVNLAYDYLTNRIAIYKSITYNRIVWLYEAGDVYKSIPVAGLSDTDWMPLVLTWSKTADQMKAYKDGAQVGATQTGLGVWTDALSPTRTVIGDLHITPFLPWDGYLAHCAVFDTALAPAAIADLAAIP